MKTAPSTELIHFLNRFLLGGVFIRAVVALWCSSTSYPGLTLLFVEHTGASLLVWAIFRSGRINLSIILMGLEVFILSLRLVELFGTAPLFHIHGLILCPLPLLFVHIPTRPRWMMMVIPLLITFVLALVPLADPPPMVLSPRAETTCSFINLFLFMIVCMGLFLYQMRRIEVQTARAETLARQRSQLIADLSHEWKTPLAAILAKIQATLSRPREPEAYRDALALCERNARYLKTLTLRMVDYQKAEQHHLTPLLEETDLPALIRDLANTLTAAAEAQGLRIETNLPEHLSFQTDPILLSMLLQNLIANAIQHAGGGTRIRLTASVSPQLSLQVEDDGPGIPPDKIPYFFDPFFRGNPSRNRDGGTVGLGLSIARETAHALGAELSARNADPHGACFDLRFSEKEIVK